MVCPCPALLLQTRNLAVGCHDLGQFITYHPQGRFIVSDLRGKELVMRLMSHPDPDVQKQALLCVQKIMLGKVSGGGGGGGGGSTGSGAG